MNLAKQFMVAAAVALAVFLVGANAKACDNNGRCVVSGDAPRDASGNSVGTVIIGGRPAGCPRRYCGCGLRKYLGLNDKRLNLAWNWARLFPRVHARPGAAGVRRGHVLLLVSHVSGTRWVVRDYNSGGGLSRIHERDVRGLVFVDPSTRIATVQP